MRDGGVVKIEILKKQSLSRLRLPLREGAFFDTLSLMHSLGFLLILYPWRAYTAPEEARPTNSASITISSRSR